MIVMQLVDGSGSFRNGCFDVWTLLGSEWELERGRCIDWLVQRGLGRVGRSGEWYVDVYIYMCVCVYVYLYVYLYVSLCRCLSTCISMYLHVYLYVYEPLSRWTLGPLVPFSSQGEMMDGLTAKVSSHTPFVLLYIKIQWFVSDSQECKQAPPTNPITANPIHSTKTHQMLNIN